MSRPQAIENIEATSEEYKQSDSSIALDREFKKGSSLKRAFVGKIQAMDKQMYQDKKNQYKQV